MSKTKTKSKRTRYSPAYRDEALALAERVGVSEAAQQLGLQPPQIYQWRTKARNEADRSQRERELAEENARLKRQLSEANEELSITKKAAAYFAKNQK
ncbi:transposase IS3/IS911 family protein [Halorhodospira halophila SL1]|uniref:Transposase IS3/IS911 family protein n=1 Tax=Halorhodospira halophila (strain DSM 244 / SL1) TaxID=349124 RepID=A1WUN8_HALHL|nr:transposase IS3/IS911 family protein [Halorhodospira halophila SL1]ABM62062.1 transposase IS3/IS911 family protein [Halorhodospira halophila SL1]